MFESTWERGWFKVPPATLYAFYFPIHAKHRIFFLPGEHPVLLKVNFTIKLLISKGNKLIKLLQPFFILAKTLLTAAIFACTKSQGKGNSPRL